MGSGGQSGRAGQAAGRAEGLRHEPAGRDARWRGRVRRARRHSSPHREHPRLDQEAVQTLCTVRSATIGINGQTLTIDPEIPTTAAKILGAARKGR